MLSFFLASYGDGYENDFTPGGSFMKSRTKVLFALLCSILIAGTPFGSMAADKIPVPPSKLGITSGTGSPPAPVTPPGNDGLLSGMTPGSYNIPSGWSLVRTQDFEGSCPEGEWCGRWSGKVTSTKPHRGSNSVEGTYSNDQADAGWSLSEGYIGTLSEVYVSFYEYIDSAARFNDEFYLAHFAVNSPTLQEVVLDWFWAPTFNSTTATLYAVSQGVQYGRFAAKTATVPTGAWVQWEIHYRPNTSGNSNGFIRIYKDGTLFSSQENANINGTANMNNMFVQVGGDYTLLSWSKNSPTCTIAGTYIGDGTDYCMVGMGWSGQSFSNPHLHPPLSNFKRYIDDIILMKR